MNGIPFIRHPAGLIIRQTGMEWSMGTTLISMSFQHTYSMVSLFLGVTPDTKLSTLNYYLVVRRELRERWVSILLIQRGAKELPRVSQPHARKPHQAAPEPVDSLHRNWPKPSMRRCPRWSLPGPADLPTTTIVRWWFQFVLPCTKTVILTQLPSLKC